MNRTHKNILMSVCGALAFATAAPNAPAAVLITSGSEPTSDIQVSQASHDIGTSIGWRNDPNLSPSLRDVGQSFAVSTAFEFTALSIFVNQTPTASAIQNAGITLDIFQVADSTSSGAAGNPGNGTLISSQAGTFPSDFSISGNTANSWLTFTLDTPLMLDANGSYVWMLSFDNPVASRSINLAFLNGNLYADGFGWVTTDGSTYSLLNGINADMSFVIQGTAVPEPTTTGLMVMGMMGAAALRLRKRGQAQTEIA